jgi:hypothetical protein
MGIAFSMWFIVTGCTKYVAESPRDKEPEEEGDDDDDSSESTTEEPDYELVGDLEITKIAIYQGVEAVLYENGDAPDTLEMPVIVGRDALLRVHVRPDDDFEERRVNGILTVTSNDGEEVFESKIRVEDASRLNDLESTINFEISGELIKQTTEFELEIREVTTDAPGDGDDEEVTWKSDDHGGLQTEATDELQIVLIPIRYNYDGSGRLPDTSDTQVQRIADLAMGLYPASSVTVRVDDPLNWPREISPWDTNDWVDILQTLNEMRAFANEPPNTYYYGLFNPESSINEFCAQGCILGLSFLGYTANDPYFRASVGIGYSGDIASETLVHEVGHAHGRDHAPCGLYGQDSDPNYPHDYAEIGTWGYDVVDGRIFDPQDTLDVMSYCSPIWVSDYTFYSFYLRMAAVAGQARSIPVARSTLQVRPDGAQALGAPLELRDTTGAPRVSVRLFDALGQEASVTTAAWFPYDHAAGGLAVLDEVLPPGWTAELVDGR